jgi:hypothetical protein
VSVKKLVIGEILKLGIDIDIGIISSLGNIFKNKIIVDVFCDIVIKERSLLLCFCYVVVCVQSNLCRRTPLGQQNCGRC